MTGALVAYKQVLINRCGDLIGSAAVWEFERAGHAVIGINNMKSQALLRPQLLGNR
jgi:hypothetical protein